MSQPHNRGEGVSFMLKTHRLALGAAVVLVTLILGTAWAQHGLGIGLGDRALGPGVPRIIGRMLGPQQRRQLHSLFAQNRDNLASLRAQVRGARRKLIDDLLGGKDTTGDVQELQTASNQLLAAHVLLAKQFVATLTDSQRQQISQFLTQWRALHERQRELLRQFGANRSSID
jgi:uncharacterized membrane protein